MCWSKRTRCGRMSCPTAGTDRGTWLPSSTRFPGLGRAGGQCGWPFTTPASWGSGSGSMIISWNSIAGLWRIKQETATWVVPWRLERTNSGSACQTTTSLISSAQSKRKRSYMFLSCFLKYCDSPLIHVVDDGTSAAAFQIKGMEWSISQHSSLQCNMMIYDTKRITCSVTCALFCNQIMGFGILRNVF